MRLAPEARHRVLSLARHAAVAAGLGVGWLLLGGSSASASSDPIPPLPVSSQVLASPVVSSPVQAASAAVKPVTAALPPSAGVQQPAPQLQNTVASAIGSTTTALGATVTAAPAVVAPVLQGPLEPLAPVVTHAASGLGQTATTVGGAISDTAAAPVPVALPDPLGPSAPAAPKPAAGSGAPSTGAPDVPAAAATAAPALAETSPGESSPAQVALADVTATQAPVVELSTDRGQASLTAGAPDWSTIWSTAAVIQQGLDASEQAPLGAPLMPEPDVPLAAPTGSGAGGAGPTSPVSGAAALAAGFLLAPLFFLLGRTRPLQGFVPASPAFDPGSTPD